MAYNHNPMTVADYLDHMRSSVGDLKAVIAGMDRHVATLDTNSVEYAEAIHFAFELMLKVRDINIAGKTFSENLMRHAG